MLAGICWIALAGGKVWLPDLLPGECPGSIRSRAHSFDRGPGGYGCLARDGERVVGKDCGSGVWGLLH